ncbi:MAG: TonB C-terminal domain-containing protein [Candidatus Omnitrophica bacterium]|nr:TonB C-terminal domain-containing protein [Candidatus Omnitrophota bacterium]
MKNKLFFAAIILLVSAGMCFAQGNKISLDIKGMDIVDVAKMLATRAGLNVVIGKNVTGKVTLFLKDVDAWDAFEIIVLANELAYEQEGDIINVMTQRDYELKYGERFQDRKQAKVVQLKYAKAIELSKALNQIKSKVGVIVVDDTSNTLALIDTPQKVKEMEDFIKVSDLPVKTRVFSLNYAAADKLSAKLQESVTKGVGSIKIDERTNKIAITDFPEKLDELAKIVAAFDEKTPQVLIDAQIIEIKPTDKFEMGVDWDYWIEKHFKLSAALPVSSSGRLLLGTTTASPAKPGQYKAIIDLLRTIGDTKILSSPRIMVLNNQEAKILVGTKDAYITSATSQTGETAVTSQSVNFVDVGIKLYVTPTINRDDFVTIKIKPEVSSAVRTDITSGGQVTQIPIVSTSEAETVVTVKDGVTIIIGGLKKDEKTKTVKKIPILGDIPLLGIPFRNISDETKTTDLIILLTPHIMAGENPYTEFSELKPKDGVVAKMTKKGDIVSEKVKVIAEKTPFFRQSAAEYYSLVSRKVQQLAVLGKPVGEKGTVKVKFTLSSDGGLKEEPNVLESDNPNLNLYAVGAVNAASPFPPFPDSMEVDFKNFSMTIEYK